ncbi:uncharacterized protein [Clytia hemisphaerica]|uniref:uncharacterized protein n=1 Tax=Clytia hemisphaerica TaxID=252671 RepID=UPI0034D728AC
MQLSYGLDQSFIDKNKHVKKNLAANLESLAQSTDKDVPNEQKEEFHELLRAYCDMFTKNIYDSKDYTYTNLKRLINNDSIVIIPGDKDSSVVVMNKVDYVNKLQAMINEGIDQGVYKHSDDNTLIDLKRFQDFLYRNFRKYEHYEKMRPTSNAPAKLYGTAKTHKFTNISDITVESIKFRPIIAQTGTCMYNAAQQTDGCTMGGPLSVTLANIFLTKMETEIVKSIKPPFYKRYVDDIITRRKINEPDYLLQSMNNYHRNIRFTIETQPTKFLDTDIILINGQVITSVHRKQNKHPTHWSSKIPKRNGVT